MMDGVPSVGVSEIAVRIFSEPNHRILVVHFLLAARTEVIVFLHQRVVADSFDRLHLATVASESFVNRQAYFFGFRSSDRLVILAAVKRIKSKIIFFSANFVSFG